ncbi:hypothetical protein [Cerasicoccus maritimus]|uniref:hypothetical protein n=1 Tax=Cerasicoccus maritimus TaxID=490089 RepID=UPI002852D8E6|nr:hypothetical protein [Cerasicoccus maritimus]
MSRGTPNAIPRQSPLTLYRKVQQDGELVQQAALQINIPTDQDRATLFFYLDQNSKVQYRLLDDPAGYHSGGSLRILNLTNQDIACLVGQDQVRLGAYKDEVKDVMNGKKRFTFAFALLEPEPYKSPVKMFPMRSNRQRMLIVFSYQQRSVKSEGGKMETILVPDATRMIDSV